MSQLWAHRKDICMHQAQGMEKEGKLVQLKMPETRSAMSALLSLTEYCYVLKTDLHSSTA